jgi:hypothetical protein
VEKYPCYKSHTASHSRTRLPQYLILGLHILGLFHSEWIFLYSGFVWPVKNVLRVFQNQDWYPIVMYFTRNGQTIRFPTALHKLIIQIVSFLNQSIRVVTEHSIIQIHQSSRQANVIMSPSVLLFGPNLSVMLCYVAVQMPRLVPALTLWVAARGRHCLRFTNYKTNSVAHNPRANYTDWATATCRRSLVITFVGRGVSLGQHGGSPTVVNLGFLDRSCYFSFK